MEGRQGIEEQCSWTGKPHLRGGRVCAFGQFAGLVMVYNCMGRYPRYIAFICCHVILLYSLPHTHPPRPSNDQQQQLHDDSGW